MNRTLTTTIGKAAFGALAVMITLGTDASACNLLSGAGLRANLASPSIRVAAPHSPEEGLQPQRGISVTGIEGLWQVVYTSGGTVVDMAFEVFHSDGTEMLNDITAPAEGNVCLGVWVQTAATTYRLTHPSWTFDAAGNLTGTADFDATITLGSADKFSGTYTLTYYDMVGTKGAVYTGAMKATRIVPNY